MFKLGDKVTFNKRIVKTSDYVDFKMLDKKQSDEFEEKNYVTVIALTDENIKPTTGIVVGSRNMKLKRFIESYYDHEYDQYRSVNSRAEFIKVYLVVSNMNFFYRVRPEWLKEVDDE